MLWQRLGNPNTNVTSCGQNKNININVKFNVTRRRPEWNTKIELNLTDNFFFNQKQVRRMISCIYSCQNKKSRFIRVNSVMRIRSQSFIKFPVMPQVGELAYLFIRSYIHLHFWLLKSPRTKCIMPCMISWHSPATRSHQILFEQVRCHIKMLNAAQ